MSSLALLIIVVEYFVHAIQWKYFFSDANNADKVEIRKPKTALFPTFLDEKQSFKFLIYLVLVVDKA